MKKTPVIRYLGLFTILTLWLLAVPGTSYAQVQNPETRRVAFYRYVEPGQATMRISVWGNVDAPGRYEVQAGTDLLELLSLAGGPSDRLRRSNETLRTSVVLSRKTDTSLSIVFEAPLSDLTTGLTPYPPLQDEDLLRIDTVISRSFNWRDGLTILGALTTSALLVLRITKIAD